MPPATSSLMATSLSMRLPAVAPGTTAIVRGKTLTAVPISQIVLPSPQELSPQRLATLRKGFNSLDEILTNPHWQGDPITLSRQGQGYTIIEGRHRVSLAAQGVIAGLRTVWALVR